MLPEDLHYPRDQHCQRLKNLSGRVGNSAKKMELASGSTQAPIGRCAASIRTAGAAGTDQALNPRFQSQAIEHRSHQGGRLVAA
jgi:hypothetical protein